MAVANTKSTLVTDADNAVYTLSNNALHNARVYSTIATLDVAAADDDNSVYRFMRVHSDWRILSIRILSGAITGGTSYHLGLYQTAANGGAVLDFDVYSTAVDISAGFLAWLELGYEARNINTVGQQVWQNGGLSANTNRWYDLALTGITVGTGAGTISMWIQYTQGSS